MSIWKRFSFFLVSTLSLLFVLNVACSKGKKEEEPPPPQSNEAAEDLRRAREAAMAFAFHQRGRLGQGVDDSDVNSFDRLLVYYMILNQHVAQGKLDQRHIRYAFGPAFAEAVVTGLSSEEQRMLLARVGATFKRSPQGNAVDLNSIFSMYSSLGGNQYQNLFR